MTGNEMRLVADGDDDSGGDDDDDDSDDWSAKTL